MVRTKADPSKKAGGKAPRKSEGLRNTSKSSNPSSSSKGNKNAGGNSYCPRPIPSWQKPITEFFPNGIDPSSDSPIDVDNNDKDCAAGSSQTIEDVLPSTSSSTTELHEDKSKPNDEDTDDV